GGADLLRRAMGKKIKAEMDAQRQSFLEGAVKRNVPEKKAADIFEQVNKFAGYGFNKSHAAAYALVAYQTAYLKANHPVEFMAASMTYDMGNTDKLNVFRQELNRLGIDLLAPDINHSHVEFRVERSAHGEAAVRYALAATKNVGSAAMKCLVQERKENGPFKSLSDFAARLDSRLVNKRQIESLAMAGAFQCLNPNRAQVHAAAEAIVRCAGALSSAREVGQGMLFGSDTGDADCGAHLRLPEIDDWPQLERLRREFEALGFYLSAHPLDAYGPSLERLGVKSYQELLSGRLSGRCKLAGIVTAKRELNSRKGNRMAFVQCSDSGGVFEVTLFSEVLGRSRDYLEASEPLLLNVSVEWMDGGEEPRLTVNDLDPLDQATARATAGMRMYLKDSEPMPLLRDLLERDGKGRGKVLLMLNLDDLEEVEVELEGRYKLSAAMRQALKSLPGVEIKDI
ncbi:MAG: DNA polymerase III subunit alpha, partial [Kiloniellales bacterium]|nr:DNA polymerase III subunit alpha [Kiloniellales bacterium]